MENKDNLYRPITHTDYTKNGKRGSKEKMAKMKENFYYVEKRIYTNDVCPLNENLFGKGLYCADDKYINITTGAKGIPVVLGGFGLLGVLLFLWGGGGEQFYEWDTGRIVSLSIFGFFLLFSILYYFTMPKKENIYDRMRGTITFPGTFWAKSITMPFSEMVFFFSTGGDDMIGAYELEIVRPTDMTRASNTFGINCYDSMALIAWYMDKNRPLPPGTAFDPYRKADFQRRKAEGFPPPLYPSNISTPEATPAQQRERNKYWKG